MTRLKSRIAAPVSCWFRWVTPSVEQAVGVARVQVNGPVEVLHRQARLVQIGVGAGPAVVGVGVLRELFDQPVEVLDGLFELLAFDTRKGPGGQGTGVARFHFQEGAEVLRRPWS